MAFCEPEKPNMAAYGLVINNATLKKAVGFEHYLGFQLLCVPLYLASFK